MLYIRADGNSTVGMGHIMRCLSIAAAMEERPVFLTACAECRPFIEERGYRVTVLPTDYRRMEEELDFLEGFLGEEGDLGAERPVFLVDSYHATAGYFNGLGRLGAVACMEDMGISYPVDLLINYNLYAPQLEYSRGLRTLLGASYAPLRLEFAESCAYDIRESVRHILLSTGGGDPLFAASGFLEAFLEEWQGEDAPVFHVVSGPVNSHAGELRAGYGGHPRVVIHEGVSDMKGLMGQCDAALAAAGSTIYELCAVGVPMVCFYFAENQRQGAECLAERIGVVNAGNYAEDAGKTAERAKRALARCISDREYRKNLHAQERRLVDGQGARRIAEKLQELAAADGAVLNAVGGPESEEK